MLNANNSASKQFSVIFLHDSPGFSPRSPLYLLDAGIKDDIHNNHYQSIRSIIFVQSIISQDFGLNSLIFYLSLTQPIHALLQENLARLIEKKGELCCFGNFVGLISDMITANEEF